MISIHLSKFKFSHSLDDFLNIIYLEKEEKIIYFLYNGISYKKSININYIKDYAVTILKGDDFSENGVFSNTKIIKNWFDYLINVKKEFKFELFEEDIYNLLLSIAIGEIDKVKCYTYKCYKKINSFKDNNFKLFMFYLSIIYNKLDVLFFLDDVIKLNTKKLKFKRHPILLSIELHNIDAVKFYVEKSNIKVNINIELLSFIIEKGNLEIFSFVFQKLNLDEVKHLLNQLYTKGNELVASNKLTILLESILNKKFEIARYIIENYDLPDDDIFIKEKIEMGYHYYLIKLLYKNNQNELIHYLIKNKKINIFSGNKDENVIDLMLNNCDLQSLNLLVENNTKIPKNYSHYEKKFKEIKCNQNKEIIELIPKLFIR